MFRLNIAFALFTATAFAIMGAGNFVNATTFTPVSYFPLVYTAGLGIFLILVMLRI